MIKHFYINSGNTAYKPGEERKLSAYQPKVNLLDDDFKTQYQPITGAVMYLGWVSTTTSSSPLINRWGPAWERRKSFVATWHCLWTSLLHTSKEGLKANVFSYGKPKSSHISGLVNSSISPKHISIVKRCKIAIHHVNIQDQHADLGTKHLGKNCAIINLSTSSRLDSRWVGFSGVFIFLQFYLLHYVFARYGKRLGLNISGIFKHARRTLVWGNKALVILRSSIYKGMV